MARIRFPCLTSIRPPLTKITRPVKQSACQEGLRGSGPRDPVDPRLLFSTASFAGRFTAASTPNPRTRRLYCRRVSSCEAAVSAAVKLPCQHLWSCRVSSCKAADMSAAVTPDAADMSRARGRPRSRQAFPGRPTGAATDRAGGRAQQEGRGQGLRGGSVGAARSPAAAACLGKPRLSTRLAVRFSTGSLLVDPTYVSP